MLTDSFESRTSHEVFDFIIAHEHADVHALLLQQKQAVGVSATWLAQQLAGRKKARLKLPSWYAQREIMYPPALNMEQCTAEVVARFRADFVQQQIGLHKHAADLTGGFGVDSYFLSTCAETLSYVEPDEDLARLAQHNHQQMGAKNILHYASTAQAFIHSSTAFDFVFIDPSRRSRQQKTYRLCDGAPDVVAMQPLLFQRTQFLMVKASPLTDIKQGVQELKHVKQVLVVALDDEVKEVGFWCDREFEGEPQIQAVMLQSNGESTHFLFRPGEEAAAVALVGAPEKYLFEPNAALLKAGAFKLISQRFQIKKIHANTHLYTSDSLPGSFPGRIFEVVSATKPDKRAATHFREGKANIVTRNYPLSPEQIRKKTGIRDGGEQYLICFSGERKKYSFAAYRLR